MNPQTLEIAGALLCLLASMAGTFVFLSRFERWSGIASRDRRASSH